MDVLVGRTGVIVLSLYLLFLFSLSRLSSRSVLIRSRRESDPSPDYSDSLSLSISYSLFIFFLCRETIVSISSPHAFHNRYSSVSISLFRVYALMIVGPASIDPFSRFSPSSFFCCSLSLLVSFTLRGVKRRDDRVLLIIVYAAVILMASLLLFLK